MRTIGLEWEKCMRFRQVYALFFRIPMCLHGVSMLLRRLTLFQNNVLKKINKKCHVNSKYYNKIDELLIPDMFMT